MLVTFGSVNRSSVLSCLKSLNLLQMTMHMTCRRVDRICTVWRAQSFFESLKWCHSETGGSVKDIGKLTVQLAFSALLRVNYGMIQFVQVTMVGGTHLKRWYDHRTGMSSCQDPLFMPLPLFIKTPSYSVIQFLDSHFNQKLQILAPIGEISQKC